jgi:hypothetical protein
MNEIQRVISLLEQQRASIDRAIEALREVEGLEVPETAREQSPATTPQPSGKQASVGGLGHSVPQFTGNKTEFVRTLVEARGSSGILPREIAEAFDARGIGRSKNFIYNTLGTLVKQKKLRKQGDRYFALAASSQATATPTKKQRLSPEGLRNIIAANKRRAAMRRAAQRVASASSPQVRPTAQKSTSRKPVAKTSGAKRAAGA